MLQSGPAGLIKTEDSFFLRNGLATIISFNLDNS